MSQVLRWNVYEKSNAFLEIANEGDIFIMMLCLFYILVLFPFLSSFSSFQYRISYSLRLCLVWL